jgi:hypothetical protein
MLFNIPHVEDTLTVDPEAVEGMRTSMNTFVDHLLLDNFRLRECIRNRDITTLSLFSEQAYEKKEKKAVFESRLLTIKESSYRIMDTGIWFLKPYSLIHLKSFFFYI